MNQSTFFCEWLNIWQSISCDSSLSLPMPLFWSEESLTRNEGEPDELLDSDEWRDVSLVTDDFFTVFCVAVRLHSVKRNLTRYRSNVIQRFDVELINIVMHLMHLNLLHWRSKCPYSNESDNQIERWEFMKWSEVKGVTWVLC